MHEAETTARLNADLGERVVIDTARMPWQASPSPGVWRKRLYLDGPAEAGRVTSIVRYDAGSRFAPHFHPDGEEFLVLEGTFGDEHGRYPAGTYVLNPDGTSHAPEVDEGCVLYVRLRQYAGADRAQRVVRPDEGAWRPGMAEGVSVRPLHRDAGRRETAALVRLAAGAGPLACARPDGEEILVLDGVLEDEDGRYPAGTWLRNPPGPVRTRRTPAGCTFLRREGWL